MTKPIYLDYNATTPHDKEVIEAMKPFLEEHFGNPSSANYYGMITRNAVEKARLQLATSLNCSPEEIIFTSGGTEANNYAIKGIATNNTHKGNHIITTIIEHPAVIEVCKYLATIGFEISYLPVNKDGIVSVEDVKKAVKNTTILISVMHANNETGAIQPIKEISHISKSKGIYFHTDAAQSMGKIPVDVEALGIDMLSIAGHKIYAPKGIGALYVKKGILLEKIIHGAGQEKGKRPGTENVLEIVGLGKAFEVASRDLDVNSVKLKKLRNKLYDGLKKKLKENIQINGDIDQILPNTLSLSFKGIIANELIEETNQHVIFSAGAACHSGITKISSVLQAMKVPELWVKGSVRLSIGKLTTENEIKKAVNYIIEAYQKLNK